MVFDVEIFLSGVLNTVTNLPLTYQKVVTVAIFMFLIVIYSIFVWKVYKLISKKDIISLNFQDYNSFEHPTMEKMWAGILYFLEYIIVLPFLILFWYVFFALTLILFSDGLSIERILLLSAAVVGSIRVLAYYKHEVSAELAKLLPMTILGLMMLSPGFLNISRMAEALTQIPELLSSIWYALIFVASLEVVLRLLDLFKRIITDEDKKKKDDDD
ncbi:MAG: hypothetical protein ACP5NS_01460 [Candidatus Pacearchaeota archaeon]